MVIIWKNKLKIVEAVVEGILVLEIKKPLSGALLSSK